MHRRQYVILFLAGIALLIVLIALAWSGGTVPPRAAAETGIRSGSLEYDGLTRTYTLTVPDSYDGAAPVPLVIALHPYASSGWAMRARADLDTQAQQHGFLVAYPDSADVHWDDGQIAAGWPTELAPVDDVGFLSALIDHLAAEYTIDPARVFLTGFERGGTMAYRAACALPERFAGVAVVNALMWDFNVAACEDPTAPVSLLILHGDQNLEFPLAGRQTYDENQRPTYFTLSMDDTLAYWAARNACDLGAAEVTFGASGLQALRCTAPESVLEMHVLPGVANNWPRTGDHALNPFGLDTAALVTQFFLDGGPLAIGDVNSGFTTGDIYAGYPRSYRAYVPPGYDPAEPLPLVIVLHGRPGTGAGMAYISDFNRVARQNNFIAVYPDGTPVAPQQIIGREWNYTRGRPESATHVDDSTFLRVLAGDLARDFAIDRDRMYITGFSNGGFMAQRVACEDPEPWAAYASVGANLFPDFIAFCADKPAASMLIMHGSADASIPWDGKQFGQAVQFYGAPFTAGFWANHAGCMTDATGVEVVPQGDPDSGTQVYIYSYGSCDPGAEVLFYAIEGGGHNLPGLTRLDPAVAGPVNLDISAPDVIWDFFSRHARAAAGGDTGQHP